MLRKLAARLVLNRLSTEEKVMLVAFGLFSFVYPFGIVLLSLDLMPFDMEWMGSLLLALLGVAAGAWLIVNFGTWGAVAGLVIFAAGMLLEGTGVATGLLFGRYRYTDVLVPQVANGVPLPIGFAWVMVVTGGLGTARWLLGGRRGNDGRWNVILSGVGALLAVGLDFLLEPVAYHVKGYWLWEEGTGGYYGVPWSNFATWFLAVFVLNLLLTLRMNLWGKLAWPWIPLALYAMNVLMFGIVCAAHGFWWAAAISALILAPIVWRLRAHPFRALLGSLL